MRKRLKKNREVEGEVESESGVKISSAFEDEANLVRAVLAEDDAANSLVSLAASESFAGVHARLMNAIETETQIQKKSKIVPAARRYQWSTPSDTRPRVWFDAINPFRTSVRLAFGRYAVALFLLAAAGLGGHRVGQNQDARALPIESIVDDFDAGAKSSAPLDFVSTDASDAKPAAHWLSTHVGRKVSLPAPRRTGTKIVGARRHEIWGRAVAQAHYLKNGVRVALYQIHEPRAGLRGLHEAKVNGETFMTGERGDYHVVVWRKGDDIMTMVSPLQREPSLRLASVLRDAPSDEADATQLASGASSDAAASTSVDNSNDDSSPGDAPPV